MCFQLFNYAYHFISHITRSKTSNEQKKHFSISVVLYSFYNYFCLSYYQ